MVMVPHADDLTVGSAHEVDALRWREVTRYRYFSVLQHCAASVPQPQRGPDAGNLANGKVLRIARSVLRLWPVRIDVIRIIRVGVEVALQRAADLIV